MTRTASVNRATRLRLLDRLALVRHAVELLHNKEIALQREQTRLEGHASRTEEQWRNQLDAARTWLLRVKALGAGPELGTIGEPATIEIQWQTSMGVTYPGSVSSTAGSTPPLVSTAALGPARAAYEQALAAGAQHAAAGVALRRVQSELVATRRRRRALEQRLEPRLEDELHQLDLVLDERDREAAIRTRLAVQNSKDRT